jgi:hypothetical protein
MVWRVATVVRDVAWSGTGMNCAVQVDAMRLVNLVAALAPGIVFVDDETIALARARSASAHDQQ